MDGIKNVLICGLGAIGSIYAVKVFQHENFVLKVLADERRVKSYKKSPLIFNGEPYCFDYVTPDFVGFKADLIIVATKNNGLEKAVYELENFVSNKTIILSLLNGIKSEEQIAKKFKNSNVLFSYYIGHTSTRKGREVIHDGVYKTVFGEKSNIIHSKAVLKVKAFFESCKIDYEIPEDMDYAMWWKFLVNVGYNQASAVLNASYGDFQKSTKANDFALKLMKEALQIAKGKGVRNTEKIIPEILEVIKTMIPKTRTSMLQDVDAKRETEVDIFAGYVCEEAEKLGIETPYNKIVYKIIKAIDEKNSI